MTNNAFRLLALLAAIAALPACTSCSLGGGNDDDRDREAPTYTIGGTVTYLGDAQGTLLLKNNKGDEVTIADGQQAFTFPTAFSDASSYSVTVESYTVDASSVGFECKITSDGSGEISGANVDSVGVTCGRDVKLDDFGAYVTAKGAVTLLYQAEDSEGNPVPGLTADDFVVKEDGIALATSESFKNIVPNTDLFFEIKTVLMIDISASIDATELAQVKAAARSLVIDASNNSALLTGQKVAVWVFDGQVTEVQGFTDDHTLLATSIDSISQAGRSDPYSTNLYSAAVQGIGLWNDQFSANAVKQGFMVLLTDGDDTSSTSTLQDVLAARGDKNIYTVAVGTAISQEGHDALAQMGNAGYLSTDAFNLLTETLQQTAEDIQEKNNSFYFLHYATPARSGTHSVELSVADNVYVGPGYSLSGEFTADDSFGVSPEILLNDTKLNVAPGDSLDLRARLLWDNAPSYDFVWSTTSPTATVVEASDDANAVLSGGTTAGSDTLSVSTTDMLGNPATVAVPVQVTEVSLNAATKMLATGESVALTATSSSSVPSFSWQVQSGSCTLSSSTGATVTLTASDSPGTCTLSVSDTSDSNVPYRTDFVVGAPGTTAIEVTAKVGGTYYEFAEPSYNFESGLMPSEMKMSGDAGWIVDSSIGADGTSHSARAGNIGNDDVSKMEIFISDVTRISFWYRVDSEPNYDEFTFLVDGVDVLRESGYVGWTYFTHTFADTGVHALKWRYRKDSREADGSDTVWVDEITIQ